MASESTRFDALFGSVTKPEAEKDTTITQALSESLSSTAKEDAFWEELTSDEQIMLKRLAVDIPADLHRKLKLRCAQTGCKQRDVVIALLKWVLDE